MAIAITTLQKGRDSSGEALSSARGQDLTHDSEVQGIELSTLFASAQSKLNELLNILVRHLPAMR